MKSLVEQAPSGPGRGGSFDISADLVKKIQYALLFGVFLLLLLLCIRMEGAADLGMHIKAGEKILLEKKGLYYDPFTYTALSPKFIDLAWLFQVVIYFIWHSAGIPGVTLFKCSILLAVFWALYKNCSIYGRNISITIPLVLMVIFTCESRFYTRSELFGFLFLNVMLHILYRFKKGDKKFLWLVVIVQFLWANSHPFYILGWAVLFCFSIGEFIEKKRIERNTAFCGLLSIAVCFVNPYTYEGVLQPFAAFAILKKSVYLQAITELVPPFSAHAGSAAALPSAILLYAYLIGISLTGIILNLRKQSFFNISIYLLFLTISLKARRNVTLFCFAALPMTVWNLAQFGSRLADFKYLKIFETMMLTGLIVFVAITGCEVASNYYYVKDRRSENFGIGISGNMPVKAVEFVKSRKIDGKMFNHFDFGGYLIWSLFPGQKLFIDGNIEAMGERHYEYYFQSMMREDLWEECVNRYEINWVITSCREVNFMRILHQNKNWALVYFDETAAIFVKESPENSEVLKERIALDANYRAGAGLKEKAFRSADLFWASTGPVKRFFNHLFVRQRIPVENINKGNVFDMLGYSGQAEEEYLNAILNGPEYWDGFFNLGMTYFFKGRYQDAIECYLKVLKIDPRHKEAGEWLAKCYQRIGPES